MMSLSAYALLMLFLTSIPLVQAEMTTQYMALPNGYNFTCTVLKRTSEDPNAKQKDIMLLHGFPYNRDWWLPLLEQWDNLLDPKTSAGAAEVVASRNSAAASLPPPPVSIRAVACDLRGYSLGASPDDVEEYTTQKFAEDVIGLAKVAGFDNGYHLLGHDHGGGLGWYMAANDVTNSIKSFVTMSIPHIQLFSNALCSQDNNKQDQDQIVAGNYINQMALEDSAYANDGGLFKTYKLFFATALGTTSQKQFQKWLWWYVAMSKLLALPPVVSQQEVEAYDGPTFFINAVRKSIPLNSTDGQCTPKPDIGVGNVEIPALLICGKNDPAILCSRPYAYDYPPNGFLPDYEHVNYDCGHNFFGKNDCDSEAETQAAMDKITSFVLGDNTPNKRYNDSDEDDEVMTSSATTRGHTFMAVVTAALLWIVL